MGSSKSKCFRFKGKRAEIVGVMVANVVGVHLLRVANDAHRVGAQLAMGKSDAH